MTRGRQPLTAIREAVPIAGKRGEVRQFVHEREMICNFVIYQPACVTLVRIKRVRRILAPLAILEREASEDIAILRSIANVAGVSRELWACSPRGSYRFFQVHADNLLELDSTGRMVAGPVYPRARERGARSTPPAPDKKTGTGVDVPLAGVPAGQPVVLGSDIACPAGAVPSPVDDGGTRPYPGDGE